MNALYHTGLVERRRRAVSVLVLTWGITSLPAWAEDAAGAAAKEYPMVELSNAVLRMRIYTPNSEAGF